MTVLRRRHRQPIVVRGTLIRIGRVGSTIVLQTTAQIYVTHVEWIPQLDDILIARIRDLYATRDYVPLEIARMFDISHQTVRHVVNGWGRFAYLSALPRPTWFGGKRLRPKEMRR